MEASSSLKKQVGSAPQQTSEDDDRTSSRRSALGRRVYSFEQGFCYIPKEDWTKGLEKHSGQNAPFYVSSLRHALIVPAGYAYPHLTLDVQESYFQHKAPPLVKVRISHAHYSSGQRLPRLAFHCRGVELSPDGKFDRDVLLHIQRCLERSPLPYRLAESVLAEQSEATPVTPPSVTAAEEFESKASSSSVADAPGQLEELSLEELSPEEQEQELADSPTSSTRPKRKRHRSRGSKQKALKKSLPEKPAERPAEQAKAEKAEKDDVEKLWLDALNLDNFLEALDTMTVDQFTDEELKYAMVFYRLGYQKMSAMIEDYSNKIMQRSTGVVEAMGRRVNLLEMAAKKHGSKQSRYHQAAQKSITLKRVEESKALDEGEDPLGVLDYRLHELTPADFLDEKLRPAGDNRLKFRGYQCAMLLLFKTQAVRCYGMRCMEFFSKAVQLCLHIDVICDELNPDLKLYFQNLKNYLSAAQGVVTAGAAARKFEGAVSVDDLKRHQDSLEPSQIWHEQALQMFYQFTCLLVDIAKHLPGLSEEDGQSLFNDTAIEPATIASINVEEQDHWQKALESMEYVRDEVVQRSDDSTASSSQ